MTWWLEILFQASVRVTLVAAVVWVALRVARVRSSSLLHTAWLGVLCAMFLMPVLPYLVPPVETPAVPVLDLVIDPVMHRAPNEPVPEGMPLPVEARNVSAPPPSPAPRMQPWPWVFALYAIGVVGMGCRLMAGWLALRPLVRASTRVAEQAAPVFVSRFIATPVTVGIVHPKILLPPDWNRWPEERLRAVLAHEAAHLQRRDTLTSLLAHVNRCVFWFHPLAWWLVKKLALTAECACDDAAVRAIGEGRRYAEVLLDMADSLRHSGHRVLWPAPGIDGAGLLGERIDRILRGGPFAGTRRLWTLITVGGCAVVVLLIAACRQQPAAPLKPDPALAADRANMEKGLRVERELDQMTKEQAAALERHLTKDPTDVDARGTLMRFYVKQKDGEAIRPHELWFIRNRPEDPLASFMNPTSYPKGYEEERKLWLQLVERQDAPPRTVVNAARFFTDIDPQLAEKLYLRAAGTSEDRMATSYLGRMYATALTGPKKDTPWAKEIRTRLDQTKDPMLLMSTGGWLENESARRGANPDSKTLARIYLERALQLKPDLTRARMELLMLAQPYRDPRFANVLKMPPSEQQYAAISALAERDRFEMLPRLAEDTYWGGEMAEYYRHDPQTAKVDWQFGRQYALDTLRLAAKYHDDPNYGTAIYKANITLGMVAMRVDGDKKAAAQYLLAASHAPPTEELTYAVDGLELKLPVLLLKYGGANERKAVIEYLERYGKVTKRSGVNMLQSAKQLRQGYMPLWYEAQSPQLR